MKLKSYSLFLSVCLGLLFLSLSAAAITPQTGTIILKDNTRYEDVPIKVDNRYKVVKIEQDGEKINISFSDIKQILNKDGEDVTGRILGRPAPRQQETWKSSEDESFAKGRKKLWHSSLELNGNFSIPTSYYYEGINSGIGFGGQFTVAFTEKLAGMAIFSKSGAKVKDGHTVLYSQDLNYVYEEDISISILRFFAAVQYYNRPDRETPGKSIYYFYSGLGVVSNKFTIDGSIREVSTGLVENFSESISESYFAMTIGGGMIQMLSPNIGFDFGASADLLFIGTIPGTNQIQEAYIFDFKAGLVLFMGKDK